MRNIERRVTPKKHYLAADELKSMPKKELWQRLLEAAGKPTENRLCGPKITISTS
jgi:hypothetical protein